MSKVHFIGGEKGGVGKSMVARLLAQYHIDNGKVFIGFDSDSSHETFSRFYGEFTSPVDVNDFESWDMLIEAAEESGEADIIIDLAAQTTNALRSWIEDSDAFGILQDMGYGVFFWHVVDDGADSMRLLENALRHLSHPNVTFVIVQNFGRGEDFVRGRG